jgi:hypothetical protein
MEAIKSAAIKIKTGEIFLGSSHLFAVVELERTYPDWVSLGLKPESGFMTTSGRFVDRIEAERIAEAASQIDPKRRLERKSNVEVKLEESDCQKGLKVGLDSKDLI